MLVNDLNELGELVRRRRTSLGLSQSALAEQIGSTRQWVSRLESGKNDLSAARLLAVLDALELNLDLRPPREAVVRPMPANTAHAGFRREGAAQGFRTAMSTGGEFRSILPVDALQAITSRRTQHSAPVAAMVAAVDRFRREVDDESTPPASEQDDDRP